jgi:hypothetical protein
MKIAVMRKYKLPMSFQTAENQMKALKLLLIKLPATIALASMIVFFIIAIYCNPMLPILMMHHCISLASQMPLSGAVWLFLSALIGVLALSRHKPKIFDKVSGLKM